MQFLSTIWLFIELHLQKLLNIATSHKYIASFITGALLSFIQAPYNVWILIFPCFAMLYFLYCKASSLKQSFLIGFLFAFGYFVLGLYWIGNALLVDGNSYKWAWPLAVLALPALLSLFTGLYVALAHLIGQKEKLTGLLAFCSLLALSEWVRGYAFTGFPWNLYGYGWSSVTQVIQTLSLFGPYGLTLLTIFWGCSLGFISLFKQHRLWIGSFTLLSLIASYEYGHYRLFYAEKEFDTTVQFNIVQPNINQEDKWKAEKLAQNFEQHVELSTPAVKARKSIIIWPETSIGPALYQNSTVQERIQSVLSPNDLLLSGALIRKEDGSFHNALSAWEYRQQPQHLYSKSHLVPFGEYIPFQNLVPLKTVTQFSGFARGEGSRKINLDSYPSVQPLICYEIIFPHEAFSKNNKRPEYILTLTNDAWYGKSPGPHQHFEQARFRAIEQGVPVVRAANTGISGIINAYGHPMKTADLMTQGNIQSYLPTQTSNKTYYSILKDWLFILLAIGALLPAIILKKLRKQSA